MSSQRTRNLIVSFITVLFFWPIAGQADQGYPHDGMIVIDCQKTFKSLFNDLDRAVRKHRMGVVGRASASMGAARNGVEIPGNGVYGIYRNDFAVRMLRASVPAGIEAPLRIYITQKPDDTSRLTYRRPTAVFKPYGSADLDVMAGELDVIFAKIAADAVAN